MTIKEFLKDIPLELAKEICSTREAFTAEDSFNKPKEFCYKHCPRIVGEGDLDIHCFFDSNLTINQKEELDNTTSVSLCISTLKIIYNPVIDMLSTLKEKIQ